MLKFAIASEGETDQIVIENILCGYYRDTDLRSEIGYVYPLDKTQQKRLEDKFSNWELLLKHISTKRFRKDVINNKYMIVQIDTDISDHKNFGVSKHNLSIEELIEKVIERLISQIDSEREFYQKYKEKIIFAISVHSLECWILPIYADKKSIIQCEDKLKYAVATSKSKKIQKLKVDKKDGNAIANYKKLTSDFTKYKELMKIISKNKSFEIFINRLPKEI